ncbi:MAG: hypothetical protein HY594_04780 [Candidatus Omnitrophica bacterium]|nr:hypothetical protein [Candidatus Omnitrophota bacterium]
MNKAVAVVLMAGLAGGGFYVHHRYNHDHRFRRQMNQRMEGVKEWYEGFFFEDKGMSEDFSDAGSVKNWNQQQRDFHEGRIDGRDLLKTSPEEREGARRPRGSRNRATGTDHSVD